jgi:hypothetical protein
MDKIMGFHKRYVPTLDVVEKQYEEKTLEEFVNYYAKPDALIGNVESMNFIDKVIKNYYENLQKEGK